MKKTVFKFRAVVIVVIAALSLCFFSACKEKEDEIITIKGKVLSILSPCHGNQIIISVENIQNIGTSGTLSLSQDSVLAFQNSIGIPLFYKFDDAASINYQVEGLEKIDNLIEGGTITFECKVKTLAEDALFQSNVNCLNLWGSPNVPLYIVTKVIKYQN